VLRRFAISFFLVLIGICAWGRTRPHYGGTLRVEIEGDPWNGPDGLARRLILDGLTTIGANGTPQPALAVRWASENNDQRWQFWLRPGVRLQNTEPLTAAMVVNSLNRSCQVDCPWNTVRDVGSSIVFTSDSPMPNLPELLAGDGYLVGFDTDPPFGMIGTGPFQQTGALVSNGMQRYIANESCWQGRPFLDAIEITEHKSIRDQWLDLSVGRADVVEVPAEMLREARQQKLTLTVSAPVMLLALQVSDSSALAKPELRGAIAHAVDRSSLFNVIFQKQGEITASLLPQELTGYAFLFSTERDLSKAHELRGGLSTPQLTMTAEGNGAMQLAAQRIALNLREVGFTVQVVNHAQHADLTLRKLPIEGAKPASAMENLLRSAGQFTPVTETTPAALFQAEREFLKLNTLVPLIDVPRAYAFGGRVRDFALRADGIPDLASVSLEDAP
jgi:peptide/nickel transport system substrate-binding protein